MDKCKTMKPHICGGKMNPVFADVCGKTPSNKVCEAIVCKALVGCSN